MRRKSSANRASSKLTRHRRASEVRASSVAARVLRLRLGAGLVAGTPGAVPLAIFGGDATGTGATTGTGAGASGGWAPGLTLADVPPTECFEESRVDTLRGRWWCGRRGMFW